MMQGRVADAPLLKQRAGVSARGRKLRNPYAHFTAAWPPGQAPTRDEQLELVHVLPPGFHRIRYYGFLANRNRQQKIAACRRLLNQPPLPEAEPAGPATADDYRDRYEALTGHSLRRCPACHGGNMHLVDDLAGEWGLCGHSGFVVTGRPTLARRSPQLPCSPGPVDVRFRLLAAAPRRPS